ncbi:single-stranded-DNA-specific exonuclease RecJ [Helicobacter sp.]|uniref:single-stranded-DNA-specific exonuclease RecJ n=1 Tax=Helicobacter sp. TaxID=218 RepID=UPI0025BA7959|nr:single-stranded-DNA-specific exonuclease RecJ [Helicobacter sp.]MCI5968928.1 single-stranded-DNA-specific exonuclease RecJ [Helicobacter sp.]MDY2584326.1 single-stranded-DNA-specific exonuclease RecJ [Helicobacter sp.]
MIAHFKRLDFKGVESLLKERFAKEKIKSLKDLPKPEKLNNLIEIATRIKVAMEAKRRIVVVGDYDVDGVASCAILHAFFQKISYPIGVEIPNRFSDGYGLSKSVIERLECDVIITVDNGINAIEAAEICKDRGIELLITDHHTPQEILPNALICNPKLSIDFPESEICGACVAWYLCAGLKQVLGVEVAMVEFLDLLALAIVSDVMPLLGMNRVLLKKGLEVLKGSQRMAFVHLKEQFCRLNLDAQLISYYIAPLLNCAGRMDSAMLAYRFLIEDNVLESQMLLDALLGINTERKALQNAIYTEARREFCAQENYREIPFILTYNPSWHEGIVGIIAARLSEEFFKPCIVLTQKDGILKGSMRSSCIDCMEVLESASEHLVAFGGHFGAAGLSLKKEALGDFKKALMRFSYAQKVESNFSDVLGYLPLNVVGDAFFAMVQSFAPFGNANAIPKFYVEAKIVYVRYFGAGHSQLRLSDGTAVCNALVFNQDLRERQGKKIACLYYLQWDSFKQSVVLYVKHYTFL